MYVPLRVEAHFWFRPRTELDSRLKPSPSIQALKVVRDTNRKHLKFIAQHEEKLLQRIDPEYVNHIYMQFGLSPPEPDDYSYSDSGNEDVEPYRRGDLEPITVVGLRSHHHPIAQVRAEALATWQSMRKHYYDNLQPAGVGSSSCVVQNGNALSEAGIWINQETTGSEEPTESSTSPSLSSSASDCDNEYAGGDIQWDMHGSIWSDGEGDTDSLDEHRSDLFPALSEGDHWLTELPTPPPSDTHSPAPSPVLAEGQLAPTAGTCDPNPSTGYPASVVSDLVAEELSQVLNDKRILEVFLDGIVKRIKESYMSRSEKEAEKAVEHQGYRITHRKGQKPPGEGRGDPRRTLRFRRSLTVSPEQARQHKLEEMCKAHFETYFQMTHKYEDDAGKVHSEPVATEGLPPENKFEWMKADRKQQSWF
ncbi:hypothetical protein UCDDA912_g10797 [Diaporthe ampelina]|uniref:Uncharacterized protein n=1 Tax=Diaporthe ampelina TaxID=1214573 RepID=A0A0G2F3D3_9PEZI|nr:hypothetical protein UCDDA912_g10797 [Diaporthe ampelina]